MMIFLSLLIFLFLQNSLRNPLPRWLLIILLLLCPLGASAQTAANKNIIVKNIKIKDENKNGRLVIYFDQAKSYRVFTLSNPPRLVINMVGNLKAKNVKLVSNSWVKSYRINNGLKNEVGKKDTQGQLVLDLKKNIKVKNATHHNGGKGNFSIIAVITNSKTMAVFNRPSKNWQSGVKIASKKKKETTKPAVKKTKKTASKKKTTKKNTKKTAKKKTASKKTNEKKPIAAAAKPNATTATDAVGALIAATDPDNNPFAVRDQLDNIIKKNDNIVAPAKKSKPRIIRQAQRDSKKSTPRSRSSKPLIAIDAGHGGRDSGAIGRRGTKEKLLNLAVAKQMAAALRSSGRYRVLLTRSGDYFIPLRERYRIAERAKADFFISIHADSFGNPNVLGASIYTLSNVASDRETARIARRENNSDKYTSIFERGVPFDAKVILLGLGQKQKDTHSKIFAKLVARKLPPTIPFLRRSPHRFAPFTVMKSVTVPSVLLEIGFLSSVKQEKEIASPAFRIRLSRCMVKAFDEYFYKIIMQRGCGLR